jgi:hypothetical protein
MKVCCFCRIKAEEAVSEPDLRERVRDMTTRALQDRRLSFSELRDIVGAVTAGVGSGLDAAAVKSRPGSSRRWMVWTMPSAARRRRFP